jgi:hypothetical protein
MHCFFAFLKFTELKESELEEYNCFKKAENEHTFLYSGLDEPKAKLLSTRSTELGFASSVQWQTTYRYSIS